MPQPLVFVILALPLVGAYAMYATGIVVIHRASRVLNLAHGAMAAIPAYVVYSIVEAGIPIALAVPIGIGSGALLGVLIERLFVRRLRDAGSTAQTVGTVAAFGLLIALAAKIWGTGGLSAPAVFPEGHLDVGDSILRVGQIGLLGVAIVGALGLTALFRFTWLGLAMRGAAVNRRAAALMGVDPDMTSSVAWALGGGLAATAGILLAAVTVLHPVSLSASVLPAFVAALIGGLESLAAALGGAVIVGVVIGLVPLLADVPGLAGIFGQVGAAELALALAAMVVMAARGRRLAPADARASGDAPATLPTATAAAMGSPARRSLPRISPRALLIVVVGWVWIPGIPFSILDDANQALLYTIAAASLVLLTGWIGQISLAHAAFVGIGAFGSIQIAERLGIPFPFTIPAAAAVAAGMAVLLGVVALRVRGLYLAVATLIFAWMADQYLFSAPWLVGAGGSARATVEPIGYEGGFPFFDFTEPRTFYLLALAGAALVLIGLSNLKRSKTGRAFLAIRGSELSAASVGIDVTRYKLLAFATSGAIAGVAGALLAVGQGTIVSAQFTTTASLFFLSIAVVGGLRSLGGAVAASVLFAALNQLFFRVEQLHGWLDVVSAGVLVAVLLFYPGGLARAQHVLVPLVARAPWNRLRSAVPADRGVRPSDRVPGPAGRARALLGRFGRELRGVFVEIGQAGDTVLASAEQRAPSRWRPRVRAVRRSWRGIGGEARDLRRAAASIGARLARFGREVEMPADAAPETPDLLATSATQRPVRREPVLGDGRFADALLAAEDATVSFGGVVAVDQVSLAVRAGEIVGLIGPNGAGKTTMFNAIAGFVSPADGRIRARGADLTDLAVHERAARGIGRTFQTVQLSPDLTVRENIMVATHTRNPAGFVSDLVVTDRSLIGEQRAAARVHAAAELTGLGELLDTTVGRLPFSTMRMVELARALASGAPLIMLDEPASGLDRTETARLARLLSSLREQLGLTVLLIEHDVSLVTSLCDYVYVLDRGRLIAEGSPETVQRDPAVIEAYLGRTPVPTG